jgi:hypothetical protein
MKRLTLSALAIRYTITFIFPGVLNTSMVTTYVPIDVGGNLLGYRVTLLENPAPSGSPVIFDVVLNNLISTFNQSIFGSGLKPSYSEFDGSDYSGEPNIGDFNAFIGGITFLSSGDVLQGTILQVGSSRPGTGGTLVLYVG